MPYEMPQTPRRTHSLLRAQSPDPLLLGSTRSTGRQTLYEMQDKSNTRHVFQSSPAITSHPVLNLFSSPPLNSVPSLPSDAVTLEPSESQALRRNQLSSSLSSLSSHINPPRPAEPDPPPVPEHHKEIPEQIHEGIWAPRRNLRARKPEQLRPYTVDSALYKYLTRGNPNARYSTREERRLLLQSQEDEEFQPPQDMEESQTQEKETRMYERSASPFSRPRSKDTPQRNDLPEFLRHEIDSDDDEPEGIREARKRGALALKKLAQEERERKKKAAERKYVKTSSRKHNTKVIPEAFPDILETPLSGSQPSVCSQSLGIFFFIHDLLGRCSI
jgi:hypothetical protein